MLPQEQQKKIQTNKQKFWDKKGIIVSQNNRPQSYNILNKSGNISARNRRHLIPNTKIFNIKHD